MAVFEIVNLRLLRIIDFVMTLHYKYCPTVQGSQRGDIMEQLGRLSVELIKDFCNTYGGSPRRLDSVLENLEA